MEIPKGFQEEYLKESWEKTQENPGGISDAVSGTIRVKISEGIL